MLGDLRIIGYKQLKSIEVKDKSLENIRSLIIKNNPKLRQITFKNDACKYTVNVEIASWTGYILLIWSSSPDITYYRERVILWDSQIDLD